MTIAEVHGKLGSVSSEDLLTSDVFTAFRYLPAESGIYAFLKKIPGLAEMLPDLAKNEAVVATIHFWPKGTNQSREPDVLLALQVGSRLIHIVVEAKYRSGASDKEEYVEIQQDGSVEKLGNQLADQLRDLHHGKYKIFYRGRRNQRISLDSKPDDRFLLYLTAHATKPQREIKQARSQYSLAEHNLFWANWFDVYDHLLEQQIIGLDFPYQEIIDDICLLLDRKSFSTFQGFSELPNIDSNYLIRSIWQDDPVMTNYFTGIQKPSLKFDMEEINGSFWQATTF